MPVVSTSTPQKLSLGNIEVCAATDPEQVAKYVGLRYVTDASQGIIRKRAGKHFSYIGLDGKAIHDPAELQRIKKIGVPPAWTNVWICPTDRGHILATGRDAKGRKQYRYHPRWREIRDETKYDKLINFGKALPGLREHVEHDLALPGFPYEKVIATCRRCYVHPGVIDAYMDGSLVNFFKHYNENALRNSRAGLLPEETKVLAFLEQISAH